jgi:Fe-S cluster assembly protein SufD
MTTKTQATRPADLAPPEGPARAAAAAPAQAAAVEPALSVSAAPGPAAAPSPPIQIAAHDRDLAAAAPYLADWEAFRRELPADEPAWLAALRRSAIERFAVLGFPTVRQEEWRFTNLTPLARAAFRRLPPAPDPSQPTADPYDVLSPVTAEDLAPWIFEAAARLVFVDGRLSRQLSTFGGGRWELPAGVVVESLAAALEREPRRLAPYLGRHTAFQEQPFVALNTAFLRDGALVIVPPHVVVAGPIHLLYLSTPGAFAGAAAGSQGRGHSLHGGAPHATVSYPRNLIVAEEGSQVTVVETYAGTGAYWSCGVTELIAGAGAVIDHCKVQRESRDAFHLATFQLYAGRGSAISSHSVSLGGALVRNDVNALLDGEGIDCILNGLYLAEGRQVVDNHMRVEHAKPHCSSHELYKGILDGKARSVFNGLIHVHPGAQKTDAKQSNRNLLLSADAIANSNPRLEIFADDVRCTHGSTVGQLDDDAIFYLRSRGIGEDAARSLLTYAFASDVLARIKVEPVRHDLEEVLFARLPQGEVVRQAV